jgi:DMSO reductase family type II enzyme chaperone
METDKRRIEQAYARASIYHYLSTLFVYPEPAAWERLRALSVEDLEHALSYLGWSTEEPARAQRRLREMTREKFEAEHVMIFGHTAAGELRPYEAGYGTHHVFQETHALADVAGFYRAFGLETCEVQRERPDHIAVELEFMHVLALKEAYALMHRWTAQADLCHHTESSFLRDHLGRWAPSFLKRLGDRTSNGIFDLIARATAVCLKTHCQDAGVDPGPEDFELALSSADADGTNFSCASACAAGTGDSVPALEP